MQHDTPAEQPDDDDDATRIDPRLKALYQAALLDEDFQQQVSANLKQLPDTDSALTSTSAFVQDETLSPAMRERLQALTDAWSESSVTPRAPKMSWWQRWWRPEGWTLLALPAPGFSLPVTLMAGMAFGMLLMPLLRQSAPPELHLRQSPAAADPLAVCVTNAAVRSDPEQYWQAIQACEAQLSRIKQAFRRDFPNYQPPSP